MSKAANDRLVVFLHLHERFNNERNKDRKSHYRHELKVAYDEMPWSEKREIYRLATLLGIDT